MLSVVLLNWNRKEEIIKTLFDLSLQTYKDFEIVLIDQGSQDGSIEVIQEQFPWIRQIKLFKNLGVPGGRNMGALNARGDILVFLDNDASLECNALERIAQRFSKESNLGIIGFKILNANTGVLDLSSWVYEKNRLKDANNEFYSYTFCGCGNAIRKNVLEDAGYYWEDLFFGWEEMDLSIKVLAAGFKIVYDPSIVVKHRISNERRTSNSKHECLRLINSLWVLWRYMPIGYALGESIKRIVVYGIKGIKHRCFGLMIVYLILSFKKFNLLFRRKDKIPEDIFREYKALIDRGPISQQIKDLFFSKYV